MAERGAIMTVIGIRCPKCSVEFAAKDKEDAAAIATLHKQTGCYVASYSEPNMTRLEAAAANSILETAQYGEAC